MGAVRGLRLGCTLAPEGLGGTFPLEPPPCEVPRLPCGALTGLAGLLEAGAEPVGQVQMLRGGQVCH